MFEIEFTELLLQWFGCLVCTLHS
uniref:Uncharacterized protein n=1 Tax=Rhizophora mucronata TaxID=61149 RepID=A0A2P2QRM3_RHIMU